MRQQSNGVLAAAARKPTARNRISMSRTASTPRPTTVIWNLPVINEYVTLENFNMQKNNAIGVLGLRIILLLVAACIFLLGYAILCLMHGTNSAASFWSNPFVWGTIPLMLYLLAAFVMNLPYFPLVLHAIAFYPVQILLLALFAYLFAFYTRAFFLPLTFVFGLFFGLWYICLYGRLENTPLPVVEKKPLDAHSVSSTSVSPPEKHEGDLY